MTPGAPDDSSAQELAAIKTNKGTSKEPDVVDVSAAIAVEGRGRRLLRSLQGGDLGRDPGQHEVPRWLLVRGLLRRHLFRDQHQGRKEPSEVLGRPQKPEYKGQVAIDGNPGSAGDAFAAVFSAALAIGGSLNNIMPGLEYFQHLKSIGNFNTTDCYPANIVSGETPIAIVWDYLNLAYKKQYPEINSR